MHRRRSSGSALLLAVIVILVISVLAVGMVRYSFSEVAGATAGARHVALSQCADAARQLLMSKFHSLGVKPTEITALNVPLGGATGSTRALGGHFDTMNVTIGQVTPLPGTAIGPPVANDGTAIVQLIGQGGAPLKVVVHCQDGTRQLEVEFGVKFGL
jgi:hypothetical protein